MPESKAIDDVSKEQINQFVASAILFASVVKSNVGSKASRGSTPSPMTIRHDRIRDALEKFEKANSKMIELTS